MGRGDRQRRGQIEGTCLPLRLRTAQSLFIGQLLVLHSKVIGAVAALELGCATQERGVTSPRAGGQTLSSPCGPISCRFTENTGNQLARPAAVVSGGRWGNILENLALKLAPRRGVTALLA